MTTSAKSRSHPTVFMMDLLAIVPYYTAYLSRALLAEGVPVTVGSIPYYLDRECFRSRGVSLAPGLLHIAAIPGLPRALRRALKLVEGSLNLLMLAARFVFRPPQILHVQFLPLLQWRLPLEPWFLRFCRWRGIKIVLTVHDILPHDSGGSFRNTYRKLYSNVDALICHSAEVRSRLIAEFAIAAGKISVIPHGPLFYDLPETAPVAARESEACTVLWQGIFQPYKGVDLLLEAWRQVESSGTKAKLVIAGTGSRALLDQASAQVRQLDLRNVQLDLRFLSAEELVALYRRADIVVYPYRAITTSGALATGLALGKAIIATDLPVFREALHEGADGVLVPINDPRSLANAILQLCNNPEERTALATRVKSGNFAATAWNEITQCTAEVYRGLVQ